MSAQSSMLVKQNGRGQPKRVLLVGCALRTLSLRHLVLEKFPDVTVKETENLGSAMQHTDQTYSLILIDEDHRDDALCLAKSSETYFGGSVAAIVFFEPEKIHQYVGLCWNKTSIKSFLSMNMDLKQWYLALDLMLNGGSYVDPAIMDCLLRTDVRTNSNNETKLEMEADKEEYASLEELTNRELEVLDLVSRGLQNKNIAVELGLSENTIKQHMSHITSKLGISNRTQAAARYLEKQVSLAPRLDALTV